MPLLSFVDKRPLINSFSLTPSLFRKLYS